MRRSKFLVSVAVTAAFILRTAILNSADIPIERPVQRLMTADALERAAMRCATASDARVLYDVFLSDKKVPDIERDTAAERHQDWKLRSAEGMLRFGESWVSEDERRRTQERVSDQLDQAWGLITVGNADLAKDRLVEASKLDPEDIRADFTLGLLNSLVARSPRIAARHFGECIKRQPNHVAAMNNLAVCSVRQRKYASAVTHWRNAISVAPASPEIMQNLARFVDQANRGVIRVPAGSVKSASLLFAKASLFPEAAAPEKRRGWMMMRLYVSGSLAPRLPENMLEANDHEAVHPREFFDDAKDGAISREFVATDACVGAIVSRGFVAADARLLENGDTFAIVAPGGRTLLRAEFKQERVMNGIGLLRCDDLIDFSAGPISKRMADNNERVVIATPARIRGTAASPDVGSGSVVSFPLRPKGKLRLIEPDSRSYGGSGVVCDEDGAMLGFVLERPLGVDNAYRVFLSAASMRGFMREHIPSFSERGLADEGGNRKPDEVVAQSTVIVVAYRRSFDVGLASNEKIAEWTRDWVPYEDAWCSVCNGSATIDCPRVGCARGGVTVRKRVEIGRNPITGATIWTTKSTRVACPTCRGADRVRCPHCVNGVDR